MTQNRYSEGQYALFFQIQTATISPTEAEANAISFTGDD